MASLFDALGAHASPGRVRSVSSAERWLFGAACVFLSAILLFPLWHAQYPAMADYPPHLARAHIVVDELLHGREHPYYAVRHALIPNLALDAVVPLLALSGLGTDNAMRVFAGLALLLPVAGTLALGLVLQRAVPWLALLAFPLAYSRYYAWGFLNYFFALGVALLVVAFWLHVRARADWPRGAWRAAPVLALLGALVMTCHLVALGVLALLIGAHELWLARAAGWRWKPALPAVAALTACACAYLLFFERGLPLNFAWEEDLIVRVRNLASPFVAYSLVLGLAVGAGGTVALAWLAKEKRLAIVPGWWAGCGAIALAFLLLPTMVMGSYYVSARLAVVVPLVWLGFAGLRAARLRHKALIVALAALLTGVKVVDVHSTWSRHANDYAEIRETLQALPARARLATVFYATRPGILPIRHAAAFAVIDRDAFVPNLYAFPFNGESVAFRDEVLPLAARTKRDHVIFGPQEEAPWAFYCTAYDFVLVASYDATPRAQPPCATLAVATGRFSVYKLRP